MSGADLTADDLRAALAHFWHPVCTAGELAAASGGVLAVRLLDRELVVADLGTAGLACLVDRCLHRSTRLSVGCAGDGSIRCAYHGWRWGADGRCLEVPSAPGAPISTRARLPSFPVQERYGLVWVCLDGRAGLPVPPCPAFDDPALKVVAGVPYTWPVSVARRTENFTDLSHFAWVHDGSLGRRDRPVPPVPAVRRAGGALRFAYRSPPLEDQRDVALVGDSEYLMVLPATVDIAFDIAGQPGVRRHLWMTASPVDDRTCRTFWLVARSDRLDEPDDEVMAFQQQVLDEDEPVVCNQDPEVPLEWGGELTVKADRVSVEYRRWLFEVAMAARQGPDRIRWAVLGAPGDPCGAHLP